MRKKSVAHIFKSRLVSRLARLQFFASELWFDLVNGIATRGIKRNLEASETAIDATFYQATRPRTWSRILRVADLDPSSTTFVDLGCGKGRVLIMAAQTGFSCVIGVEFDEELVADARRNTRSRDIEVLRMDARQFIFPHDRLLVFMFNPFGTQTLRAVLRSLEASLAEAPRQVTLVYLNPVHPDPVLRVKGAEIVHYASPFPRSPSDPSLLVVRWTPC